MPYIWNDDGTPFAKRHRRGSSPPVPGHAYVGVQRYFLTICTLDRAEYFTDSHVVSVIVDHFLQTAREKGITIVVYCVMPDRMHLLIDGEHDWSEMEPFVSLAKQRAGYWFSQNHGKKLWQKGYYEHVLRDEEKTEAVVYYIIANPIRKKLVEKVMDYRSGDQGSIRGRSCCRPLVCGTPKGVPYTRSPIPDPVS